MSRQPPRIGRRGGLLGGLALVTGRRVGAATTLPALAAQLGPAGPLGCACRAALPASARDASALAAGLAERLGTTPETALGAAVRQDFAAGRVRVVDGWLLADIEVQLLAWAAVTGEAGGRAT